MKPGGGSQKGSEFERLICRKLTLWITGAEKPEIYWRTASSGAKSTMDRRAGRIGNQHADIKAIDPRGEWLTNVYVIECKHWKKIDFLSFLQQKGNLWGWWKTAVDLATDVGKLPLLIFRGNNFPIYFTVPNDRRTRDLMENMPKIFSWTLIEFDAAPNYGAYIFPFSALMNADFVPIQARLEGH